MINFALITEGKTDQAVLENIIYGFFGEDNVEVNPLQPLADATGANQFKNQQQEDLDGRYGNWLNVFKYCASEKFKSAFQLNDFLIIQIDTDVSEKEGYDVPKSYINSDSDRQELLPNELVEKVIDRLIKEIPLAVYEKFKDRILFAICVDSIECWLLPLF